MTRLGPICALLGVLGGAAHADVTGHYTGYSTAGEAALTIRADGTFQMNSVTGPWRMDGESVVLTYPGYQNLPAFDIPFTVDGQLLLSQQDSDDWFARNEDSSAVYEPRKVLPGAPFSTTLGLTTVAFTLPTGWNVTRDPGGDLFIETPGGGSIRLWISRNTGGTVGDWVRTARDVRFHNPSLRSLKRVPETYVMGKARAGYLFVDSGDNVQATAVVTQGLGQWSYEYAASYPKDDPEQVAVALDTVVTTLVPTPPVSNAKLEQAIVGCWSHFTNVRNRLVNGSTRILDKRWFVADGRYSITTSGFTASHVRGIASQEWNTSEEGTYLIFGDQLNYFPYRAASTKVGLKLKGKGLVLDKVAYTRCAP